MKRTLTLSLAAAIGTATALTSAVGWSGAAVGSAAVTPATETDMWEWPTRGSLSTDAAFVAAAEARYVVAAQGAQTVSPDGERHVLFAGDVPGGRIVVTLAEGPGTVLLGVLGGKRGAAASELNWLTGQTATVSALNSMGAKAQGRPEGFAFGISKAGAANPIVVLAAPDVSSIDVALDASRARKVAVRGGNGLAVGDLGAEVPVAPVVQVTTAHGVEHALPVFGSFDQRDPGRGVTPGTNPELR